MSGWQKGINMTENVLDVEVKDNSNANYYEVVRDYLVFSAWAKDTGYYQRNGIVSKENSSQNEEVFDMTEDRIREVQQRFNELFESVIKGTLADLSIYVDTLIQLKNERKDLSEQIDELITSPKLLMHFRNLYNQYDEILPILRVINQSFPIDAYPELSLQPEAALYGSITFDNGRSATKRYPLSNEGIQAVVEGLSKRHRKRAADWLMAILLFRSDKLDDAFKADYSDQRNRLRKWMQRKIDNDENYAKLAAKAMVQTQHLSDFVNAYLNAEKTREGQTELREKVTRLQEELEESKKTNEYRNRKLSELKEQKERNELLYRDKIHEIDSLKLDLNALQQKYNAQIAINERVVLENERRLTEMQRDYYEMQDSLTEAETKCDEMENKYEAIESDHALALDELARFKASATQKTENAKLSVKRELINGLSDQLYYLSMIYLELEETGSLETENIGTFKDVLEAVDDELHKLDINKIGMIDQKDEFDSSIHTAADGVISNGDPVVYRGFGWKIGDVVLIKALVEKEG